MSDFVVFSVLSLRFDPFPESSKDAATAFQSFLERVTIVQIGFDELEPPFFDVTRLVREEFFDLGIVRDVGSDSTNVEVSRVEEGIDDSGSLVSTRADDGDCQGRGRLFASSIGLERDSDDSSESRDEERHVKARWWEERREGRRERGTRRENFSSFLEGTSLSRNLLPLSGGMSIDRDRLRAISSSKDIFQI